MGVVRRQGFKYSVISFIGVAIGVVSTIFIYPDALELYGLFGSLFNASLLASLVVLLGSPTSAIRFFPKYRDDESSHKGLLSWLLMIYGGGFLLFLFFFPFISELMHTYLFDEQNEIYADFIIYTIPLTFCIGLINLLARYISNFRRIVIPSAFESLTIKIALPLIILMYLRGWINVEGVVICIVISYILATIGMTAYLYKLGHYRLTRPVILDDKEALKEYSKFSWYNLLSGMGSQVAFKIDGLMVAAMIQFQASGIYGIALAISDVITKPLKALGAIAGPIIANHIATGNLEELKIIYKKSALNMTITGLGLFLLIWAVLPFILEVMPNSEIMRQGTSVVFFLGLAQLFDMMTGVNGEIIVYSKYYRFTLFVTLFLAVTNIIANYFLIQTYGLPGAAIATCLSFFLYNLIKLIFIKIKFGFQPFTIPIIPVIAFGIAAWLIAQWLPNSSSPWINMFYKGAVFSSLYGAAVWKFKLSPDINQWLASAYSKWQKVRS